MPEVSLPESTTVPDDPAPGEVDPAEYLAGVLEEIDAEVRRRRASGDLPAGIERELDELFLEFSPVGLQGKAQLRENLALVDGAAFVDISVPVASRKKAGVVAKRLIRKSMGWYVGFIVHQIVKFAWSVSRMLHLVVDHIEDLESTVASLRTPDLPTAAVPMETSQGWWVDRVTTELAGVRGRVLDAECGDGSLVAGLVSAGIDAYGIDPAEGSLEGAIERGLDVRADSLLDHLEVVGEEALSAIVLHGSVQWFHPGERDRLVTLVWSRLRIGGVVLLHSATPEAWQRTAPPLVADLAPGRPLHPETWAFLLEAKGLVQAGLHRGPARALLAPLPEPVEGRSALERAEATTLNAAIAALNGLLDVTTDYLLVAIRTR